MTSKQPSDQHTSSISKRSEDNHGLGWLPQGLRSALNLDKKNSRIGLLFQRVEQEFQVILQSKNTKSQPQEEEQSSKDSSSMEECFSEIKSLLFQETNLNHSNNSTKKLLANHHPSSNVALETVQRLTATIINPSNSNTGENEDEQKEGRKSLLELLLNHLAKLPFEARKDVSCIYNNLLCNSNAMIQEKMVQFIEEHYLNLMVPLIDGYTGIYLDVALHCGSMFRTTIQHPTLYQKLVLEQPTSELLVYPFLDTLVHIANFEIASDALETLRCILTGNSHNITNNNINNNIISINNNDVNYNECMEKLTAQFLVAQYKEIFVDRFNPKLLLSSTTNMSNDNYITRRVSLQLLTTILLTRANYNVMIQYISSRSNLRTIMMLLRDPSPHITLDAFHVFKIFVANPSKPPDITKVLMDNQVKLVKYLETLHSEREKTDEQFRDEKALVIATLQGLDY